MRIKNEDPSTQDNHVASPTHAKLRLTLYSIVNMASRAMSLFAPDCASWGIPCRGTSGRSYINPLGNEGIYQFVAKANRMVSRKLGCFSFHYIIWWLFRWFMFWYTMAGGQFSSLNLRMTLCLLLVISQNCFFVVEQPSQSLLYRHHRFEWFTNRVAWVSGLIRSLIKSLIWENWESWDFKK